MKYISINLPKEKNYDGNIIIIVIDYCRVMIKFHFSWFKSNFVLIK